MNKQTNGEGGMYMKAAAAARPVHRKSLAQRMKDSWQLYLLLLIPVVITVIYKYGPMYGIQIAFRNYNPGLGITGSPWVGWKWFERFFRAPNFDRMLWNTIKLSLYGLLWGFPVPIILSLALNQLRFKKLKRYPAHKFLCVFSDELLQNEGHNATCGTERCLCPKAKMGPGDPALLNHEWCSSKAQINGTLAHITAIFGFTLAGLVMQDIKQRHP